MAGRKGTGTGAEQPERGHEPVKADRAEELSMDTENGLKMDNTGAYIYIGPTVRKGMLKENQIFTGSREEILEFLGPTIEKITQVEKLVVPASRLAELKEKAERKGTLYNKYYNDIRALDGR